MLEYDEMYQIFSSFRQVNQSFHRLFWKQEEEMEITRIQMLVLSILIEHPNIGLAELAELCHMGSSTTSGVVDRLVKAELVERDRCLHDRRSLELQVTVKGREVQKRVYELWMSKVSHMMDLPREDIDNLLRIHSLMLEKMEKER
ncbi:MarR family winged helix-turn-helix transcriptional regulator [Paenibacillus shunpengii]|uniref:MarR family winged helix-turn-helix transcriptional regulator n=1 Tax=Paenibacillus shunpengii TaxID=2054424 RepID=A0ABW5SP17_9BACL|nr:MULTISPECIES: MarR family transcriptional regulator [unclassified Paenibacillus]OMC68478.1 MarR family transcriptional regulator [Paenibacillus sp. FSL H7-0326]SDW60827.1 DNA-binding transcriptional regulator, MarR family [Paenibacillus sp. PDC88]